MTTWRGVAATLLLLTSVACNDDTVPATGGAGGEGGDGSGGGGAPSCDGTETDDPLFAQAMDELRATLDTGIPGGAIAIVQDGRLINFGVSGSKRSGMCDPITPDTLFSLPYASVALTGIAALDAVEDGELSLDGPIQDVVGPLHLDSGQQYANDVTLHHLLTASSMYTSSADAQPQEAVCTGLAESFETAEDRSIEAPPGSMQDTEDRWNAELAALALELVDGMTYPEVITARVLDPLGMGGTFHLGEVLAGDHAEGHIGVDEVDGFDCPNHYASYGYYGSINDMVKLAEFVTGGGAAILEPSTSTAMTSPQSVSYWSSDYLTYIMTGWEEPGGEHQQFVGGQTTAGFNQIFILLPERNLSVVVMLNANDFASTALGVKIAQIYGVDSEFPDWLKPEYTPTPEDLETVVGTYEDLVGFDGTGPRRLVVSQPDGPDSIVGMLTDLDGNNAQSIAFEPYFCADNFRIVGTELDVRFWRDDTGKPYAIQTRQFNGPPFFRVER